MIALYLGAPNDSNGNPRRGWVVFNDDAVAVDYVDEGYSGVGALQSAYPDVPQLPRVAVSAGELRDWKKTAQRRIGKG